MHGTLRQMASVRRANPAVKRTAMEIFPAFKEDLTFAAVERVVAANMNAPDDRLFELLCDEINAAVDAAAGAAGTPTSPEQLPPAPVSTWAPAPNPPDPEPTPAPPTAPAQAGASLVQADLFWDFDNVNPKTLRRQTTGFFSQLLAVLRERFGLRVRDSTAYLVHQRNYGDVPDKLSVLQVSMRVSSGKREAADRELSKDLQRLREGTVRRSVVIVSSDKDFTREVKDLVDAGFAVYVVHNAPINSEHAAALALHATGTLQVSTDLPTPPSEQPETFTVKLPEFVSVGDEMVATDKLLRTRALLQHCQLLEDSGGNADTIPPLKWCGKLHTDLSHDIVQCKFMHRVPETVPVMERNVPTAHLVNNKMFMWLATHHDSRGRWCSNASPDHDTADCGFAHARPGFMVVNHMTYPAEMIAENQAKRYLREHPLRSAAACSNPQQHSVETCRYVHFVGQPSAPSSAPPTASATPGVAPRSFASAVAATLPPSYSASSTAGPPPAAPAMPPPPQPQPAEPESLLVDGKRYPVNDLHRNRGVVFLLAHPHYTGSLCRHLNKPDHDVENCNFVHPKHVEPVDPDTVTEVMVEGVSTPVSELIDNPSLKYLRGTRGANGRICRHVHNPGHDPMNCNFIHPRDPSTVPKPTPPQPVTNVTHVLVDGVQQPVDAFMQSKGLEYLMAHPGQSGRICRLTPGPGHSVAECKFLHPVAGRSVAGARPGFALPANQ